MNQFLIVAVLAYSLGSAISASIFSHPNSGLRPYIFPPHAVSDRIVGGSATTIEQFPWTVSLQYNGDHRCGAAIISAKRCLTAAHCTDKITASKLSVRAGSTCSASGGQLVAVTKLHQHPKYVQRTYQNDLTVLELKTALDTKSAAVGFAPMPRHNEPVTVGSQAYVAGWGHEKEGGGVNSAHLRAVGVPIVDQEQCKKWYPGAIIDGMLCAGYAAGGKDACQNDSGGPLTVNGLLVGIVSWGVGCARPNQPGVYARVAYYRDWIDKYMETKKAVANGRREWPEWWMRN